MATDKHQNLIAAAKRAEQYIHLAIHDAVKDKVSEATVRLAQRDLEMLVDAIREAEAQ